MKSDSLSHTNFNGLLSEHLPASSPPVCGGRLPLAFAYQAPPSRIGRPIRSCSFLRTGPALEGMNVDSMKKSVQFPSRSGSAIRNFALMASQKDDDPWGVDGPLDAREPTNTINDANTINATINDVEAAPFKIEEYSLDKLVDSCAALTKKTLKTIGDITQPLNFLNKMAEDRADIDEKNDPLIKTALTVAAMKSAAGVYPNDDITPRLAGPQLMFGMSLLVNAVPDLFKELGVVSRTPWLDSRIGDIIENRSIDQVVILAAGLDTRAYRMPELKQADVYEIDLPDLISAKERLFNKLSEEISEEIEGGLEPIAKNITRIASDLSQPIWTEHLAQAGFDSDKPTLFLMEGLVYYFDEEQLDTLGRQIKSCAAEGSHLLFDCINKESIRPRQFDNILGKPSLFVSGMDEPELWLNHVGFEKSIVIQSGEFQQTSTHDEDTKKTFSRTFMGTFDSNSHLVPRNETAADGGDVRRFYFVEGVVQSKKNSAFND